MVGWSRVSGAECPSKRASSPLAPQRCHQTPTPRRGVGHVGLPQPWRLTGPGRCCGPPWGVGSPPANTQRAADFVSQWNGESQAVLNCAVRGGQPEQKGREGIPAESLSDMVRGYPGSPSQVNPGGGFVAAFVRTRLSLDPIPRLSALALDQLDGQALFLAQPPA